MMEFHSGRAPRQVVLAYLHPGHVTFGFHDSVCKILRDPRYHIARVERRSSADIERARNAVARWFVDMAPGASHLWWVDADTVFDPSVLQHLLDARRPIVSAFIHQQNDNGVIWPVGLREDGKGGLRRLRSDELEENEGEIEVAAVGMGCCLIEYQVLQELSPATLWPYSSMKLANGEGCEPDVAFCLRAREKGYKTYIRTDCRVGHVKDRVI